MKKILAAAILFCNAFSYLEMLPRPRLNPADDPTWEFKITATNTVSDWILFPQIRGVGSLTCQLQIASNSAQVEYTASTFTDLTNGTALVFVWPLGTVSTNAISTWAGALTAVRFRSFTNVLRGTVIAQ